MKKKYFVGLLAIIAVFALACKKEKVRINENSNSVEKKQNVAVTKSGSGVLQVIDFKTGNNPPGQTDSEWDVLEHSNSSSHAAHVVLSTFNGWPADTNCGDWITHATDPGNSTAPFIGFPNTTFTYTFDFTYAPSSSNPVGSIVLNINKLAADNEVVGVYFNNYLLNIPYSPKINFSSNILTNYAESIPINHLQTGSNSLKIEIKNDNWEDGILACGNIVICDNNVCTPICNNTLSVDLSTGNGSLGSADNNWLARHGGTAFGPAYITTGLNERISGLVLNDWILGPCSWLSPFISGSNHALEHPLSSSGTWFFKYDFVIPGCDVSSATLNLPFIAADNNINKIIVGNYGVPASFFNGISFANPGSINSLTIPGSALTPGLNSIYIEVFDSGEWVGLNLCGALDITYCTSCCP